MVTSSRHWGLHDPILLNVPAPHSPPAMAQPAPLEQGVQHTAMGGTARSTLPWGDTALGWAQTCHGNGASLSFVLRTSPQGPVLPA